MVVDVLMKKKIIFVIMLIVLFVVGLIVFFNLSDTNNINIEKMFSTKEYESYTSGDRIDFKDQSWYVMYDSSTKDEYVTLISSNYIYVEDIPYLNDLKDVEDYMNDKLLSLYEKDNLKEVNGNYIRLINFDDVTKLLDFEYVEEDDSYVFNDCPSYICLNNSVYSTMISTTGVIDGVYSNYDEIENPDIEDYELHLNYYVIYKEDDKEGMKSIVDDANLYIRPIIYVLKSSIEG